MDSEYDSIFEFLTMVDDIAVSVSSNRDPVSFSRQWPKFFEGSGCYHVKQKKN